MTITAWLLLVYDYNSTVVIGMIITVRTYMVVIGMIITVRTYMVVIGMIITVHGCCWYDYIGCL